MGFFTRNELAKTAKIVISVDQLRPDCLKCGLYKKCSSPKMEVFGEGKKKILVIGEFPTTMDDEYGVPLSDDTGELFKDYLHFEKISLRRDCWTINAVSCSPGNSLPSHAQIKACFPKVRKHILELKPKLIVLLGSIAVTSVYGDLFSNRKIERWRGFIIPDQEFKCNVLPIFSPWQIKDKERDKNLQSLYKRDIKKIPVALHKPYTEQKNQEGDVHILTDVKAVETLLNRILQRKAKIMFDYETTGLKPYRAGHKIVSIGIAVSSTKAFVFPFNYKSFWTHEELKHIKELWKKVLLCPETKKMAHNCFTGETEYITEHGVKSFKESVNTVQNVWNIDGWTPAQISCFGEDKITELGVVPYNCIKTSTNPIINHTINTTKNHRWFILRRKQIDTKIKYFPLEATTDQLKIRDRIIAKCPKFSINKNSEAFKHGATFATRSKTPKSQSTEVCSFQIRPPVNKNAQYIAEFIEGWQLLDGAHHTTKGESIVLTRDEEAAKWLRDNCVCGGWICSGFSSHIQTDLKSPGFAGSKYWRIVITRQNDMSWIVKKIINTQKIKPIFCATVLDGKDEFLLQHGVYTKNCKFEAMWSIVQAGTRPVNWHWDTMMAAHCFPKEVEFLTSQGWKSCKNITKSDSIAQLDTTTNIISYKKPLKVVSTYTHKLVYLKSKTLNFCCTPEHDLLHRIRKTGEIVKISAHEAVTNRKELNFLGAGICESKESTHSDEEIKLFAALLSDGYFLVRNKRIQPIYGFGFTVKKERKIQRLQKILTSLSIKFSVSIRKDKTTQIRIFNTEYGIKLQKLFPNKLLNFKFAQQLGLVQLRVFLMEFNFFDGSYTYTKTFPNSIRITQKEKINIDVLQSMFCRAGYRVRGISRKVITNYGEGVFYTLSANSKRYFICEIESADVKIIDKKTRVYCVTTEKGTIVTRYKGHVLVTGNCLDNRSASTGLKFQAFVQFGVRPYDEEIKSYLKSKNGEFNTVEKAPFKELMTYNGLDCIYAWMLYTEQKRKLSGMKGLSRAYKFFMAGLRTMGTIQHSGIPVNEEYYKNLKGKLTKRIDSLNKYLCEGREASKFKKYFGRDIKITSNQDLGKLFYEVLGKPAVTTAIGNYKTDKATLESLNLPFVEKLLEMKKFEKARGTYLAQFAREVVNEKMHPFFDLHIPVSYRSCIAGYEKVLVMRNCKSAPLCVPIKDIRKGDYVYCYDDDLNPTIQKVLWQGKTGHREIIRIHWHRKGKRGHLDCTLEHKIRLITGKYLQAKDLLTKQRTGKCFVLSITMQNCIFMPGNQEITKVEILNKSTDVYDIEVEKYHNFIVNEICVHNSSSMPNFQNLPKRDPEISGMIRKGIVPSKDCVICEADFSGAEVNVSCSYHKDKNFYKYLTEKDANGKLINDMHRDFAQEIWLLPLDMLTNPAYDKSQQKLVKMIRFYAKNLWTFAQFYGDWFKSCGENLWESCIKSNLKLPTGISLKEHLESKGIYELGEVIKSGPTPGSFLEHCAHVEDKMWNERFPEYTQWKKDVVQFYQKYGYIETFFGFRFVGFMNSKQCCNFPIQSTSFHLLVYTLIMVERFLYKHKLRTKLIGQVHDSIILDLHKEEIKFVLIEITKIVASLKNKFTWLLVPMEIEIELSKLREDGGNFAEMTEYSLDRVCEIY